MTWARFTVQLFEVKLVAYYSKSICLQRPVLLSTSPSQMGWSLKYVGRVRWESRILELSSTRRQVQRITDWLRLLQGRLAFLSAAAVRR